MVIPKTYITLLLAVASNGVSEAASLRQVQRNLGATYVQSDEFLSAMLDCVNKERAAENLPAVCANKKLQSSSQRHTDDMAAQNYMAHDGSDGSTMSQRITEAGYDWSTVGENVAAGQEDVEAVMDAWMHSPEHRENIMGNYTMLGVSYAFNDGSTYKHYWTQDFGKGDNEECDSSPDTDSDNQGQQDEIDSDETPVPKTSVHVTEAPETETPCPDEEETDAPVQETTPAPEVSEVETPKAETPTPETQQSVEETQAPGKVSPASDCNPKF